MTLARILQAAKKSMLQGHHAPYYYSAWEDEGYLRQLERKVQGEIDNMGFASEYAEPGYNKPTKGILFADWNCFPRGLHSILEKAGYAVEWSDEWFICDCTKAVRTEPDSYGWQPSYKDVNGEFMCKECAAIEEEEE